MSETNFDLYPSRNIDSPRIKGEIRQLVDHYWKVNDTLGTKFPIYRAMDKQYAGQDIVPFLQGNTAMGQEPKSAEQALKELLEKGEYSLLGIAWQHASHNFNNDPTLSWTTDLEFAQERAKKIAELHGNGSVIVQSEGSAMPFGVAEYTDLRPNFAIHIPTLAEIRGGLPSEQSKVENEVVTFGVFPADKYKVLEEVK